jgi:dihydroorotate dehydrogenase
MIYEKLLRPALFATWADPEDAHEHTMANLVRASRSKLIAGAVASITTVKNPALQRSLFGIDFRNPVGLAGGFDKNAQAIRAFEMLGFGFIEVGTVTWHPQPGNPRPRVFRYPQDQAIINRFGFNNEGAQAMADRLAADTAPRRAALGISLGKSKITPLADAVEDYLKSLRVLYPHGDYFAINVSSPNTPGLRQLQDKAALDELLAALDEEGDALERKAAAADTKRAAAATATAGLNEQAATGASPAKPDGQQSTADQPAKAKVELNVGSSPDPGQNTSAPRIPRTRKPILVKIAPDLEPQALDELLQVCRRRHVDGVIATNTTLSRDGLNTPTTETGGLSGRPLFPRSLAIIRHIRQQNPEIPIIGVGGIMSPENATQMLEAGANLLQIYTALIYKGPMFVREINREIMRSSRHSA